MAISALCCPYFWFEPYVIMLWKYVAFPSLKPQITQHVFTCICINPLSSMTLTVNLYPANVENRVSS